MKRKTSALCLLLLGVITAGVGFTACDFLKQGGDEALRSEVESVTMGVSYDESSGEISWEHIENTAKYVVSVRLRGETTEEIYETVETSCVVALKSGINFVTVKAYDSDGKEIGMGTKTVSMEFDYGAPEAPTNLAYDEATGTISWVASEHAAKYIVNVTSYTDEEYSEQETVTDTSVELVLASGVYGISVYGENAKGAKGESAYLEWASYVDQEFNKDTDGNGTYTIISFANERVLELSRKSDYKGWETGVVGTDVTASVTTDPALGEGETGENVLLVSQPSSENRFFVGTTFRLPEQIAIEDLGILSFEVYRTTGNTVGVMYEDENGVQVSCAFSWSNEVGSDAYNTYNQWGVITTTAEKLLEQNEDFAGIKEITFYANNATGGDYYFRNVEYDSLGEIAEISYDKETRTVSWRAVRNAVEYTLEIDGEEVYCGTNNFYVSDVALDAESALSAAIKLTAKAEDDRVREKETEISFFGEISTVSYVTRTATVSWKEVEGAELYVLTNDAGETLYEGTGRTYAFETALTGDFSLTLAAIRGDTEKLETFSYCLCAELYPSENNTHFNASTGTEDEYYLADFTIHNYNSVEGNSSAAVEKDVDGLRFDVTIAWNGKVTYTLPKVVSSETIEGVDAEIVNLASISFRYKKSLSSANAIVYFEDCNGTSAYLNLDGSSCSRVQDGDWIVSTVAWENVVNESTKLHITNIRLITFTLNKASNVVYDSITYVAETFNSVVDAETGEYLLVGASNRFLTMVSSVEYPVEKEIADGALKITQNATQSWWQGGAQINFPTTIDFVKMDKLIIRVKTSGKPVYFKLVDENGKTCYIATNSEGVTTETDGEWTVWTVDIATQLARTDSNAFDQTTTPTKFAGLQMASNTGNTVMEIQSITYTQKQ